MNQNYFVYNGKRYGPGTIFKIKNPNSKCYYDTEAQAVFIGCNHDNDFYIFTVYDKTYRYHKNCFYNSLIEVIGGADVETASKYMPRSMQNKEYSFRKELDIDGMLIAWLWYVFIVAIGTIFYARIIIWIIASVVFFNYRSQKLKEEGYKS